MYKIPELLAPVGGLEQLKAAVENGADAVYMGSTAFNARMSADNFGREAMADAVDYAHTRNVRVYVTVNTLLTSEELPLAVKTVAECWEAGADAFILQDYGFAALLKQYFAQIPLHLSTQATVFNTESAVFARKQGFNRVVLARETPLEEIRRITAECGVETEVFIHGALCICYSGQCQMSRHIGTRSGNRGTCAQPCRLPYEIFGEKTGDKPLASGYLLSPKDICGIDHLAGLAEAGVASLKIEGRLKSPEYVAVATGIYRKYLDQYASSGAYQVAREDRDKLAQIFNRGGFTEGYLLGNPGGALMSPLIPKHQGVAVGTVTGWDAKKRHVKVRLTKSLNMGDGVEIYRKGGPAADGGKLPGNVVTLMRSQSGKGITAAEAGEEITIGYIEGTLNQGDTVRRVTDKALMKEARLSFETKSWQQEKEARKETVFLEFTARLGEPASLTAQDWRGHEVEVQSEMACEQAVSKPLTEELVIKQLLKTGGTPFQAKVKSLLIEEGISLPVSALNNMRRQALEALTGKLTEKTERLIPQSVLQAALKAAEAKGEAPPEVQVIAKIAAVQEAGSDGNSGVTAYLFGPALDDAFVKKAADWRLRSDSGIWKLNRIALPYWCFLEKRLAGCLSALEEEGITAVPYLPAISQGRHDEIIRRRFDELAQIACRHGIYIGSMGWIGPFVQAGARVFGDYGLNLFNREDGKLLRQLGIKRAVLGHEMKDSPDEPDLIRELADLGLEPEVVLGGSLPVMHSAHCPVGDLRLKPGKTGETCGNCQNDRFFFRDRKGEKFGIFSDPTDGSSVIFGNKERIGTEKLRLRTEKIPVSFRIYGNGESLFCNVSEP